VIEHLKQEEQIYEEMAQEALTYLGVDEQEFMIT
jgi:hypothetical protein